MSALIERQGEFQDYLLGRSRQILERIKSTNKEAAEQLMSVYADGYVARLIEVLGQHYPKLAAYLGNDSFTSLTRAYIKQYPSQNPNARWYGHLLPRFIAEQSSYANQRLVSDLAHFEWTLGLAFDAADAEPLTSAAMSALAPEDWGDARFQFHPSLHRLELASNATNIWQALDQKDALPAESTEKLDPQTWLLWRQDLMTYFRSIDTDEASALTRAQDGATFGELCDHLTDYMDEEVAAGRAAQHLAQWFANGLIVSLETT